MGNYYVSESRASLQLSILPTLERDYGTLFILTGARLEKGHSKNELGNFC